MELEHVLRYGESAQVFWSGTSDSKDTKYVQHHISTFIIFQHFARYNLVLNTQIPMQLVSTAVSEDECEVMTWHCSAVHLTHLTQNFTAGVVHQEIRSSPRCIVALLYFY